MLKTSMRRLLRQRPTHYPKLAPAGRMASRVELVCEKRPRHWHAGQLVEVQGNRPLPRAAVTQCCIN